jgi:hypothetical protein
MADATATASSETRGHQRSTGGQLGKWSVPTITGRRPTPTTLHGSDPGLGGPANCRRRGVRPPSRGTVRCPPGQVNFSAPLSGDHDHGVVGDPQLVDLANCSPTTQCSSDLFATASDGLVRNPVLGRRNSTLCRMLGRSADALLAAGQQPAPPAHSAAQSLPDLPVAFESVGRPN